MSVNFDISMYASITSFMLVILINLLLIIPVLKTKKISSAVRMLSFYLLIGVLLSCGSLIINFLKILNPNINCHLVNISSAFYSIPTELSVLNLSINSFFVLTNNYFFLSRQKQALIIFSLINWIPPLSSFLVYFCIGYYYNFQEENCDVKNTILNLLINFLRFSMEVISCIICVIMLIYLCRVNTENNEILKHSKRKSIFKKISFIIAIIIFVFSKLILTTISFPETFKLYFYSFFCLLFLVFEFIFLWDQRLKESILNTYCCKTSEEINDVINASDTKELLKYDDKM